MLKKSITWIHLSDCHMEATDRFNRNVVLHALWEDIRQLRERGLAADFIAFTGDVAYHGVSAEYDLAAREFFDPLLAAAEVPKERVFLVPGNHDVDRRKTAMLANPLGSITSEDDLKRLMENSEERGLILSPLRSYQNFLESYFGSSGNRTFGPFGTTEAIVGEEPLRILCLNTSWLSGFSCDSKGVIDDCRHLAVSEFQLRNLLSEIPSFTIALMHHPLDWLIEFDQLAIEDLLTRSCPVILRGHLHRPNAFATQSLAGESITIPAGAVFDRRRGADSPNSYNVAQFNFETRTLSVFFRRYNDRREEWQKDIESTGEGLDGRADFSFKVAKKSWATVTSQTFTSRDIAQYKCSMTQICRNNLVNLKLSKSDLLSLVQAEFDSHVNYFIFDLEHYPLPLGTRYIVYLHKVQDRIQFEQVIRATHNQIQLARWNDLLTLYRRATRLDYRLDPMRLTLVNGVAERACALQHELGRRMLKYYTEFEHLPLKTGLRKKGLNKRHRLSVKLDEVLAHLRASHASLIEVGEVAEAINLGDISAERAVGLMAASLETSLQHLHKLILLYPPRG
jgi:hypothetical protein